MNEQSRPHHLLFTRRTWNSQVDTRRLRNLKSLIVPMYDTPHAELHAELFTVPVLDAKTAGVVRGLYVPATSYIGSMNNLMLTIDEVIKDRRADPIQKQLGELVIASLEIQIPHIKEGQVK